jgi:hypothetical protein
MHQLTSVTPGHVLAGYALLRGHSVRRPPAGDFKYVYLDCDRAGNYESKARVRKKAPSKKCGCEFKLRIFRRDAVDEEEDEFFGIRSG